MTDTVKKSRKSVNKTLDKVLDISSIPLPESPVNLYVLPEGDCHLQQLLHANSVFRKQAAANAEQSLNNALVPAQNLQKDLTVRAKNVSNTLIKFTGARQVHIEKTIGTLQAVCLGLAST